MGRFSADDKVYVKIPAKWSQVTQWDLTATPVENDFIEKYFPKLNHLTLTINDATHVAVGTLLGGALIGGVTCYFYGDQIK